jgi:F-type H+-transporting ATPase subunit b
MELIEKLGIDLKMLIAQIFNFFILLFVLYKLVYKPILGLLDKRSKMIEKSVEDAKKIEEKLANVEEDTKKRINEVESKATIILENAKKEADRQKEEMKSQTQEEITRMIEKGKQNLMAEKEKIVNDIKKEAAAFVIMASQKVIEREFSAQDQERLQKVINEELKSVK